MAKRIGSSARGDRALRRTDDKSLARPSAAVAKGAKKLSPHAVKAAAGSKRAVKAVAIAPAQDTSKPGSARRPRARAAAPRSDVRAYPASEPSALPPPRIPTPPPPLVPRSMELEWTGDPGGSSPPTEDAFDKWVRRGDELLLKLAEHGASEHEYRTNLREGTFYWVDPAGRVSAEARAQLLCTFVPQTSSVTMGWADPRMRGFAVQPVAGMPPEIDDVDEEGAWRIAMATADGTTADYLYRVRSAAQCMFLGLSGLTFSPGQSAFVPATPVGLVLSALGEARVATNLGAEPVDTLRARLSAAGAVMLEQAQYAHRDTDWSFRLVRTGRRLGALAERLPRPTFHSVAEGGSTVWLDRKLADDLIESLVLLEEEWRQFA